MNAGQPKITEQQTIMDKINELAKLKTNFYNKDFLLTSEHTDDELKAVLLIAEILEKMYAQNISTKVFDSGLAISQFRDNSTRTRFSFASAANLLGLSLQELDEGKSQIAHGETVRETSVMISFLSQVIGIRDDLFIGKGNTYMREVSKSLEEGHKDKVLQQRPSVINLQCDIDHPTQSMADLRHLEKYFGGLDKLKGKKIAMTWAYSPSYGKPLSVPQGIITLMTRYGMHVTLAHPQGYDLMQSTLDIAAANAKKNGGSFKIVNSMDEAFKDADIVYPKSWAPFAVMEKRTKLLEAGKNDELKALEKECLENNAKFKEWECDEKKMKLTKNGKALYMHCLPADISSVSCKQGEVAASVFDRYRNDTYVEASYKPLVIAAMIMLTRVQNPATVLSALVQKSQKRVA